MIVAVDLKTEKEQSVNKTHPDIKEEKTIIQSETLTENTIRMLNSS